MGLWKYGLGVPDASFVSHAFDAGLLLIALLENFNPVDDEQNRGGLNFAERWEAWFSARVLLHVP